MYDYICTCFSTSTLVYKLNYLSKYSAVNGSRTILKNEKKLMDILVYNATLVIIL